jgi:hypothetical protein
MNYSQIETPKPIKNQYLTSNSRDYKVQPLSTKNGNSNKDFILTSKIIVYKLNPAW